MKIISSRENPLFKSLKKLEESSKERRKARKTVLDGEHLIDAYISAIGNPGLIVISSSAANAAEPHYFLEKFQHSDLVVMPDGMFRELSPVKTPTGIIAIIDIPVIEANGGQADFGVLLEDIQDPGNLGSILRSAAAAGVQMAYLSNKCADVWSPKVLRAGMGAHFCLTIYENHDLLKAAHAFSGAIVATSLNASKSLFDLNLTGPVSFVIGNEGVGLSSALQDAATDRVSIPMPGKIESLNAASAASICFFERVRQMQK